MGDFPIFPSVPFLFPPHPAQKSEEAGRWSRRGALQRHCQEHVWCLKNRRELLWHGWEIVKLGKHICWGWRETVGVRFLIVWRHLQTQKEERLKRTLRCWTRIRIIGILSWIFKIYIHRCRNSYRCVHTYTCICIATSSNGYIKWPDFGV